MTMSFKTFLSSVQPAIDMGLPILLRSRHGVGKSMLVYQLAEKMSLPVIERRASQMTEGDLLGLPKITKASTSWLPPDWLHRACQEPVVLFFDELDRGILEVRQGLFELADSRKIAGHVLHPGTKIFAAINGGIHGAQYSVNIMDPAELDRWVSFDLEPTVEDWLEWARGAGIGNLVLDFIAQNPSHLEHMGEFEPNKVYPSRRSWHRFDQAIRGKKILVAKNPAPSLLHLAGGFLGLEASIALTDYARKCEEDVNAEDIMLRFGEVEEQVRKFSNVDFNAMIEKLRNHKPFGEVWDEAALDNVSKFLVLVPSEIFMPLSQSMLYDNIMKLVNIPFMRDKMINSVTCATAEKEEEKK
jgi:hypothetical protein